MSIYSIFVLMGMVLNDPNVDFSNSEFDDHQLVCGIQFQSPINSICSLKAMCLSHIDEHYYVSSTAPPHSLSNVRNETVLGYLAAVDDFPQYSVRFLSVYGKEVGLQDEETLSGQTIVIHRFKPDNVMHVLHDDILPLLDTMRSMKRLDQAVTTIMFVDDYGEMPYDTFYEVLTSKQLMYHPLDKHPLCIQQMWFGSHRKTLWYDYGFRSPQKAMDYEKPHVADVINVFKKQFFRHYSFKQPSVTRQILLFSRSHNRLILNENLLILNLAKTFRAPVKRVSEDSDTLNEIIFSVQTSKIIIGMHGATLALVMFAQPGSTLIELFPYAVNSDHYTPYKHLAKIVDVNYESWQNANVSNTRFHPEYPAHHGGLYHLDESEREKITSQTEVPRHACCSDASWLYHIYQDTYVNESEVVEIIRSYSLEHDEL